MKIKSCPFCGPGTNPKVRRPKLENSSKTYQYVTCNGCLAQGPEAFKKETAILFWNKRSKRGAR